MEKNETVLFDPGYAPIVIDSIGQIGYTYYMFSAINNLKIKKINFPGVLNKLEKYLKTNVAFYLGCMLWASYIKQFKGAKIEGNKLLGEVCEEKEYLSEIEFLIDFVKSTLLRDSKYYLNKTYTPDKRYLPILEAYREFLILNKGFCSCANVDDIILPNSIKALEEFEEANKNIQEAIKEGNIDGLLDNSYSLLF